MPKESTYGLCDNAHPSQGTVLLMIFVDGEEAGVVAAINSSEPQVSERDEFVHGCVVEGGVALQAYDE